MNKLLEEIKTDVNFIRSHSLQPTWYKFLKVFILVGFLAGYWYLFGPVRTAVFLAVFLFLSLLLHLLYRVKTNKWKRSWLDFVVVEEGNEIRPKGIGLFYYSAIIFNAIVSLVISQLISFE